MDGRPYFHHSSAELEAVAQQSWNSQAGLRELLAELGFRSTPKAQKLERQIEARLRDIQGTGVHEARSPKHEQNGKQLAARALRAEQRVRELEVELTQTKAEIARLAGLRADPLEDLYRQVGLHPTCPDFVMTVAQRAFRKEYHPDALSDRPVSEQKEAEERFKDIDNIFAKIAKQRRLATS